MKGEVIKKNVPERKRTKYINQRGLNKAVIYVMHKKIQRKKKEKKSIQEEDIDRIY